MNGIRTSFALTAILIATGGCLSGAGDPVEPIPGSGGDVISQDYPSENIGTSVGKVIANYLFEGYRNPAEGIGPDHRMMISLGDFFNPTGEESYGNESPFEEGSPKPTALMITVGAVFCHPCQSEAKHVLPGKYDALKPQGMELLAVLSRNISSDGATFKDLDNWVTTYAVDYPSVIDPKMHMANVADPNLFPANMVIDTRTMKIAAFTTGPPGDTFWSQVDAVIADE